MPRANPTGSAMSMAAAMSSSVAGRRSRDLVQDWALGGDGIAPVTGQHVAHVDEVLDVQLLVETELDADTLDLLGPGARADVDGRGVGRHEAGQDERDDRDARQDDGRGSEAAQQEPEYMPVESSSGGAKGARVAFATRAPVRAGAYSAGCSG